MRHCYRNRVVFVDVQDPVPRRPDRGRFEVVADGVKRILTAAGIFFERSADFQLPDFAVESEFVGHRFKILTFAEKTTTVF